MAIMRYFDKMQQAFALMPSFKYLQIVMFHI